MRRRDFVIGVGAAALTGAVKAADPYPAKPIRWLVGFAPGGASDVVVRLVAEGMQKELGVPVPIVIRMEGTNVDEGQRLLRDSGMNFSTADSMDEAATRVVQLAGS